jgi:hypothetical protein
MKITKIPQLILKQFNAYWIKWKANMEPKCVLLQYRVKSGQIKQFHFFFIAISPLKAMKCANLSTHSHKERSIHFSTVNNRFINFFTSFNQFNVLNWYYAFSLSLCLGTVISCTIVFNDVGNTNKFERDCWNWHTFKYRSKYFAWHISALIWISRLNSNCSLISFYILLCFIWVRKITIERRERKRERERERQ